MRAVQYVKFGLFVAAVLVLIAFITRNAAKPVTVDFIFFERHTNALALILVSVFLGMALCWGLTFFRRAAKRG